MDAVRTECYVSGVREVRSTFLNTNRSLECLSGGDVVCKQAYTLAAPLAPRAVIDSESRTSS